MRQQGRHLNPTTAPLLSLTTRYRAAGARAGAGPGDHTPLSSNPPHTPPSSLVSLRIWVRGGPLLRAALVRVICLLVLVLRRRLLVLRLGPPAGPLPGGAPATRRPAAPALGSRLGALDAVVAALLVRGGALVGGLVREKWGERAV